MSRINISITNEKAIERLERLSKNLEGVSYASIVAMALFEYENSGIVRQRKVKA